MAASKNNAEKILARFKGLSTHLLPEETPIVALPAIWDNGQSTNSTLCDVVITNQRVIGFYFRTFPRERLFIDAIKLTDIQSVTIRTKTHEPIFRELAINAGERKLYIRAPKNKIEELYAAIREAIARYGSNTSSSPNVEPAVVTEVVQSSPNGTITQETIYGRQEIKTAFERSITGILFLFYGGILFEIVGTLAWIGTHDAQIGLPLCIAGFFAVATSIWVRRQQR